MKNPLWFCTALVLFIIPFAAQAQFPSTPKSRPASAPQATTAEVQAPAPAPIQAAPPTVNVAPSAITVSPQLMAPAPAFMDEVKTWMNTTFLGLLTAIGGWIGVRGLKTAAPSTGGPPAIVADVIAKFSDPATKQVLEAHGLQLALAAAQNPLVNTAAQAGLSIVPGLGAAEPIIRSLGIKALQDIIAKQSA